MLILKYLRMKAKWDWSLWNLVALLRMNLFTHQDLWTRIDRPLEELPPIPHGEPNFRKLAGLDK